jgi:3-oxoacyl-[acyl-carrier protein] reductase
VEIRGKAAVVTGGSRGIGQAIVERLSEEGAHVLVVDLEGADAFGADVTQRATSRG